MREENTAPRISASLCLSGMDFSPKDFFASVGLRATDECAEAKVTGTVAETGEPFVRSPYWTYGLRKLPLYSLSDALERLLDEVYVYREAILNYLEERKGKDIRASFIATVTMHKDRPLFDLGPNVLQRLAAFGFEFSLDIFDYRD